MSKPLKVGDRVELSGGYDFEPSWLGGLPSHPGVVSSFIPGQNDMPAAVVRLDNAITAKGTTGDIVVLELRYVGQGWQDTGTVHIELCDFVPEERAWQQRRQGKWVESHATYKRVR
jgi:hypothetical protein